MKTVTRYIARQRPVKGGRFHGSTGFEPRVWRALEKEAQRFGVSIPFVLSTMAAHVLQIDLDEADDYRKRMHIVHRSPARRKAS